MSILGIIEIIIIILWIRTGSTGSRIFLGVLLFLAVFISIGTFLGAQILVYTISGTCWAILLWAAYYLIFQITPSKENQTMQGEQFNQASNSYAICIANSGYTLRPRDLTIPNKGYVVGLSTSQPELIKDNDFTLEMYVKSFNDVARSIPNDNQGTLIAEYVNDDQELIKVSTDLCVGAWLHEGYWYVESTQVIADIRDAMYLAKSNNQKAVYDLAEKKEIFVKDYFDTKAQS